ncbi:MAG: C13 family peptidase, partial [Promethearchaeota archaeon]
TIGDFGENPRIHFSLQEIFNDPYARYLRIYIDEVKIWETVIYPSLNGHYSNVIDAPQLKWKNNEFLDTHEILIEIFWGANEDGEYNTPSYKLDYFQLSKIEFDQIELDGFYESKTLIGSQNRNFPDIGHSILCFTIKTNKSYLGEFPQIHFSLQEIFNDPYTRYLRVHVDGVKIWETIIYPSLNGHYSNVINAPQLMWKTPIYFDESLNAHEILIEIFWGANEDGEYNTPSYKLDYFQLSKIVFEQIDVYNYITMNSPLATTYTSPSSGYYPATYGFEDTANGAVPSGWTEYSPGNAWVKVESGIGGHNKVMRLYDPFQWFYLPYAQVYNTFANQQYGTVEFWFRTTNAAGIHLVEFFSGSTIRFRLKVDDGGVWVDDGNWHLIGVTPTIYANIWYRFKIDFETTEGNYAGLAPYHFRITVNEDVGIPLDFKSMGDINKLKFATTDWDTDYSMYIDAVGYSWDPYYDIMDNKYPGLFVEFSPDNLEYMSLTLDGQSREIFGDIVLPMLKSGPHTISIWGYDNLGFDYYSGIRTFTVNMAEKIGVIFYASDAGDDPAGTTAWSEAVESNINDYINILMGESYFRIYVYRDVGNENEFDTIMDWLANNRIDQSDELFIYIWAHGSYNDESYTESYSCISTNGYYLSATHFEEKMKYIYQQSNSSKLGSLVESCYSGWFSRRFANDDPFLAMSSTDTWQLSKGSSITHEFYFSAGFWDCVASGYDASEAFYLTKDNWWVKVFLWDQEPQIRDNTPIDFMFFN